MTNNNFNTEFLDHIIDDEVWKDLSREFKWTLPYLTKYADRVDWKLVSGNTAMVWSAAMLEAFKGRIDWRELSGTSERSLFTTANLDKFANYWDWRELSENGYLPFSIDLLTRYADHWDWAAIIHNYGICDAVGFNRAFLDRFKDFIPMSKLQDSSLWNKIVEERKDELAGKILAEDA